jgi:site-specific DNA recombinase
MEQKLPTIKYFIYSRRSSEQEDRQVLSIPAQLDEMKKIVSDRGIEARVIDTLSESRSAKYPGRPLFDKMLDDIAKGKANGIIAWHANRLSRNSVDIGRLIYLMDQGKLSEVITPGQTFRNTPGDKMMLSFFCGVAKYENDNKGEDVKRGLRRKADMGWLPNGAKPGYMNDPLAEKGNKKIMKDPERFLIIQEAWRLALTGVWTIPKILEHINTKLGYRSPKRRSMGGKPMARSQIYTVFKDPFYYGSFEFPVGSGNWKKGLHEPMITEEEFWRVQELLGRKGRPRPKTLVHDFVGMMRCGECGGSIIADEKNQIICTGCKYKFAYGNKEACPRCDLTIAEMKNPTILKYIYWRCSKRVNGHCTQGSIEQKELERQILAEIDSIEIPPEFHKFAMKWLREESKKDASSAEALLASYQKENAKVLEKIQGLIDMRAAQEITPEEFRERKASLSQEKARIEALLADAGQNTTEMLRRADDLFTFIDDAKEKFVSGSVEDRRLILAKIGSNLTIKNKKLSINIEKSLLPLKKISPVVKEIHNPLEPKNASIDQGVSGYSYEHNPMLLRDQDSNLEPSPYTLP